MSTQDGAGPRIEDMIAHACDATQCARDITDTYYLIPRADIPETTTGVDYVVTDNHTLSVNSRPKELRAEAYSLLAIADRLEAGQAKKADADRVLAEKRDAWWGWIESLGMGVAGTQDSLIYRLIDAGVEPEETK